MQVEESAIKKTISVSLLDLDQKDLIELIQTLDRGMRVNDAARIENAATSVRAALQAAKDKLTGTKTSVMRNVTEAGRLEPRASEALLLPSEKTS